MGKELSIGKHELSVTTRAFESFAKAFDGKLLEKLKKVFGNLWNLDYILGCTIRKVFNAVNNFHLMKIENDPFVLKEIFCSGNQWECLMENSWFDDKSCPK